MDPMAENTQRTSDALEALNALSRQLIDIEFGHYGKDLTREEAAKQTRMIRLMVNEVADILVFGKPAE